MSFKNVLKTLLFVSTFLFVGSSVFGASVFDNFDSYNDGNLDGQGGWVGGSAYQIQGVITHNGSIKAVEIATTTAGIEKNLPFSMTNGIFTGWIRAGHKGVDIWPIGIAVKETGSLGEIAFSDTGNIEFFSATTTILLTDYSINTWYKADVEWRSSDSKVRGRLNNGNWTAWENPHSSWTQASRIYMTGGYNGTGYFDSLSYEVPIITIPATLPADTLAYAGDLFTDLATIITLVIGLPVAFWAIKKVIALV